MLINTKIGKFTIIDIIKLLVNKRGGSMKIKSYEKQYFAQLGAVMDKARMQELEAENLEPVFVAFRDAPYLDYLLSCKI